MLAILYKQDLTRPLSQPATFTHNTPYTCALHFGQSLAVAFLPQHRAVPLCTATYSSVTGPPLVYLHHSATSHLRAPHLWSVRSRRRREKTSTSFLYSCTAVSLVAVVGTTQDYVYVVPSTLHCGQLDKPSSVRPRPKLRSTSR